MKIGLVSPYDFPYPGGVTEHVLHLAEQFRRRGHHVAVLAPSSNEGVRAESVPNVYTLGTVVPIPANGSVARVTLSLRLSSQVKEILHRERFDVVHLHEPLMPALPLTVLRHSQAVNIGTFHAFHRSNLGYFYAKPVLRYFFRKLDGRIAVSRCARDFVGTYFPAEYRIIPNGIDYERFATPAPRLPQYDDGRINVLFLGRLEKRKGVKYLIRAWMRVRQRCPNARLIVAGRGRPLESYRRFAQLHGLQDDLVFPGFVPAEDLVRYYHTCDVFCSPATGQESFGIVLLEAMAAGRPIVATEICGYSEVMTPGREGLMVPPRDEAALATALLRLIEDPDLRRRCGAAGRETAAAYSWDKVADRVLDFYAEVRERKAAMPAAEAGRFRRVRRAAAAAASLLR